MTHFSLHLLEGQPNAKDTLVRIYGCVQLPDQKDLLDFALGAGIKGT